jgi:hypothetical protein
MASSCWRLGRQRGVLGVGQRGSAETVGELGGGTWGSGEAGGGLRQRGTTACSDAAAQQRGAEEEEGGAPGAKL